ncbi:peptidoglycan DD-metalloendopeptidase family protein [Gilliamella sp. Pra-s65]|uniref:peptidoglycan DD-metalloendopeptidase family protein n=1 Tax=unclassified Gilliamella TaxID=2685620 RepID=UPI001366721D|nr:peptidoglycan DD-metalloendopeptidase family protein [Gilliamella sp. Pra-s65]MWP73563.1 peptidoglycan DD-metalloendopeptidase family protein [Gilliamella sp. Pra-s52]
MKGVALKKILTLSCLSLLIAACTQTEQAEIEDISGAGGASTSSVYTKPPTNISTGGSRTSATPSTYNPPSSRQTTAANTNTTHTTISSNGTVVSNERIVYNRNYDDIPKGGYKGDTYTVKRGDTLFYIAWVTGNDYRSLAAKNNIKEPFAVNVGQVLDVSGGTVVVTEKTTTSDTTASKTTTTSVTTTNPNQQPTTIETTETVTEPLDSANSAPSASSSMSRIAWQWPAKGKIIEKFSNVSKGIDISGSLGSKVMAAANGRVVYSGNALPGYGNLIIIKHNDDYLTAYAHNQSILVKEQQTVRAGEQIATMGATGSSSVRLHFEIRYKAQSVDPLKYLPK